MPYINVSKPTGATYTNISKPAGASISLRAGMTMGLLIPLTNAVGGSGNNSYTNISKPTGSTYVNISKPT